MQLYYFPLSTYSQKTLMAFHEKRLGFEPHLTQLFDPAQAAAYREVYPLGKIPLLVLDNGHRIPESSIIVEYLDTHYPTTPRLIPQDPERSRQTRLHDRMLDLYLNDAVVSLLFESWKPATERLQDKIDKACFRAGVMYDFLEQRLDSRHFVMGEDFSLADCAALPALFYAQQVFPFSDRPNIQAYWERLSKRESWRQVASEAQPYLDSLPKKP